MTPLSAPFPILEQGSGIGGSMVVHNRGVPTNGDFYFTNGGFHVEGWTPSGEPLPGFKGTEFSTQGNNEGLAIDNDAQFLIGRAGSPNPAAHLEEQVGVWAPGGGSQSGVISTAVSVRNPTGLAIDPNTGDLWVSGQAYPIVAHYTEE